MRTLGRSEADVPMYPPVLAVSQNLRYILQAVHSTLKFLSSNALPQAGPAELLYAIDSVAGVSSSALA